MRNLHQERKGRQGVGGVPRFQVLVKNREAPSLVDGVLLCAESAVRERTYFSALANVNDAELMQ